MAAVGSKGLFGLIRLKCTGILLTTEATGFRKDAEQPVEKLATSVTEGIDAMMVGVAACGRKRTPSVSSRHTPLIYYCGISSQDAKIVDVSRHSCGLEQDRRLEAVVLPAAVNLPPMAYGLRSARPTSTGPGHLGRHLTTSRVSPLVVALAALWCPVSSAVG